jgi:predicted O-methyltransferase YrrM
LLDSPIDEGRVGLHATAVSYVELAREARRRRAMQKERELASLLELVDRRKPRVVLEIGAGLGGAFWAFAQVAADDALLVSVDMLDGHLRIDEEQVVEILRACARDGQRTEVIRGDSHDPAVVEAVAHVLDAKPVVDFLFVDGDHSEEGVEQDFHSYAPFVRPGGLIGFHDILPRPSREWCRVDRFWRRVAPSHRTDELVDVRPGLARSGGIGVIHWEG